MITQGFGEILTDILTVNPAIKSIPSASAILDTSNYTFQALSFGKDAQGFQYHAHDLTLGGFTLFPLTFNDGFITVKVFNTVSPSSYHVSATHLQYSSTYNSTPIYPSVYDRRLEKEACLSVLERTLSSILTPVDVGHYKNYSVIPALSSLVNVIGGFPPATGSYYKFIDSNNNFIMSGVLSGMFNNYGVMDLNGYLKVNQTPAVASFSGGSIINTIGGASSLSSNPTIYLQTALELGDGGALAMFGGVNHVGVWCLDLKQMLADGLSPPFNWNILNTAGRKYKLVGKFTSWDNLLNHNDITDPTVEFIVNGLQFVLSAFGYETTNSGFKIAFQQGINNTNPLIPGSPGTNIRGPYIQLKFNFK